MSTTQLRKLQAHYRNRLTPDEQATFRAWAVAEVASANAHSGGDQDSQAIVQFISETGHHQRLSHTAALQREIDKVHNQAMMNMFLPVAAIQAAAYAPNGPKLRDILKKLNSDLLTGINELDDTLKQIDEMYGYNNVDYAAYQPMTEGLNALFKAVKSFTNNSKDTDAKQVQLQAFISAFNPQFAEMMHRSHGVKRGKRSADNPTSKLLERTDGKIYRLYTPGSGYEKAALDAAYELRRDGDREAAEYIDQRRDKRQFARDAIDREDKRRKLVCVE